MSPSPNQILTGDAATVLADLPDNLASCIVTSPPYFRLRDYGHAGQLGLEGHVDEWVSGLLDVFRQAARVLTIDGTLWLNLGDAYSTHPREGAARKSLLLGPERLATVLAADGWILRNKIVWAKPNTIPSSVRDRLSTRHEVIYLFARHPTYYFDLDAIRQPHTTTRPPGHRKTTGTRPAWLGPNSDGDDGLAKLHQAGISGHPLGKNPGDVWTQAVSTYRGAHFATYPVALVERILTAGCPERRCSRCKSAWVHRLRREGFTAVRLPARPTCHCNAAPEPGLVLDPFIGSGTTAVAAERLNRDWLGIELNPDFVTLALQRIAEARTRTRTEARTKTNPAPTKRKEVA